VTGGESVRLRRLGTATFEVAVGGDVVGTVWRTRYGYSARTSAGTLAVDDSSISRATAIGVLVSTHRDEVAS